MTEVSPSAPVATVRAVVVCGVAGSGKSTVAAVLAARLDYDVVDADDLHPCANVEKMRAGEPLDDEDRRPWLDVVGERMRQSLQEDRGIVMACSALKRRYRDQLRDYVPTAFFVMLDGSPELIGARVGARQHDFMPAALLASQFAALEPLEVDEAGLRVDVSHETGSNMDAIVEVLFGR